MVKSAGAVRYMWAAGVPLESSEDLIALDEALQRLHTFARRQGCMVELRSLAV
jgi:hypothetical protein